MHLEKDFSTYGEDRLINEIKSGNQNAFKWLVNKYEKDIAKTVVAMLGNVAEADDVGLEVFIRFYNAVDSFEGKSTIKTFLTRIAINLSLNELKKRKSKRWLVFNDNYKEYYAIPDEFSKSEIDELVQEALNTLEPNFKSVIVLRLIQGYSTKETAEILKLPQGTVLSRVARGQEKLRKIILNLEKIRYYG